MRVDVSDWEIAGEEPQGLEKHPWLRHESHERPWLFKEADLHPGRPLTDDLVEKVASEIAREVGVPAARVDLVTRDGVRGCSVETLRPSKLNRPGMSGDSIPWKGWSHVREYIEEVPGRAA